MRVRYQGRLGTAVGFPDPLYRTIRIRWDDGRVSRSTTIDEVETQLDAKRDEFVAALAELGPERTALLTAHAETQPLLLDAKIAAVWEWADTTGRLDLLGPVQLQRLAGRVMAGGTLDLQFEELCNVLGLDPLGLLVQTEDVRIDAASFAAACRDRPERTVAGDASLHLSSGWFEKLGLIV